MTNNTLDLLLIDGYNSSNIIIGDISIYAINYTVPSELQLEITPPGFSKITVDFKTKDINIYRALDLGLTCDDTCMELPDGIYEVKYSTPAPKVATITKYFLKVDKIKNMYQSSFLKLDLDCNCPSEEIKKNKDKIKQALLLIEGAIASANTCDLINTQKLYNKAYCILSNINKCN